MRIYVFDQTRLIGYVDDYKVFDLEGRRVHVAKPETTISTIVKILLRSRIPYEV